MGLQHILWSTKSHGRTAKMTRGWFFTPQEQQVRIERRIGNFSRPQCVSGHPKPVTYTHKMMATPDIAASLTGIKESYNHQYAFKRWYTPLPVLHVSVSGKKTEEWLANMSESMLVC